MRQVEYRSAAGAAYEVKDRNRAVPVMLGKKETRSEFLKKFGCPQHVIDKTAPRRERRSVSTARWMGSEERNKLVDDLNRKRCAQIGAIVARDAEQFQRTERLRTLRMLHRGF